MSVAIVLLWCYDKRNNLKEKVKILYTVEILYTDHSNDAIFLL